LTEVAELPADAFNRIVVTADGAVWVLSGAERLFRYEDDALTLDLTLDPLSFSATPIPRPGNKIWLFNPLLPGDSNYVEIDALGNESAVTLAAGSGDINSLLSHPSVTWASLNEVVLNGTSNDAGDQTVTRIILTGSVPPLRQRQRDDSYNAPRMAWGSRNAPRSRQESIRQGHGNTYL
jgi:hypothetical protein